MNDNELSNRLNKVAENISVDSAWKQAAKAGLLKELPNIPQNKKPPRDVTKSMRRINPGSVTAVALTVTALIAGALYASRNIDDQAAYTQTPTELIATEVITRQPTEEVDVAAETASEVPDCLGANPRRIISIGSTVRVINAQIPLRSAPEAAGDNIIASLPPGTLLEVIGAPVCTPFLEGANLWWFVRAQDGTEGYAAEGSALTDTYYLEEIK